MVIIYSALNLGGIETFFLRLAKSRFLKGKKTKIILYIPKDLVVYDEYLYVELGKYAEIYHFNDVFLKVFLNWRFLFLHKLNIDSLRNIFINCEQVHVADAYSGLLANKFLHELNLEKPITFGVYHTMEYSWGDQKKLPYFERVNREFIYKNNNSSNLICFSNETKEILEKRIGVDLSNAQTFRLGVIETLGVEEKEYNHGVVKICAVGRLADFKTYNLWMPNVIKKIRERGFNVVLDIYGSGELEERLKSIISEHVGYVNLFPSFSYSKFREIVSGYDLFIGSGTSIIEASSLGIPSIIGIESIDSPKTYGYFCDFCDFEYNILGLPFELQPVEDVVEKFMKFNDLERDILSKKHRFASEKFHISVCDDNFDEMQKNITPYFCFDSYLYIFSRMFFHKKLTFFKKTIYHDC